MKDPLFESTVILICEHDENGAMGLIINKEIKKNVSFSNTENDKELIKTLNDNKLFIGGPVLTDRILFLHSLKKIPDSIIVNKEVSVSIDLNILELVRNSGDQDYKLFLGHSGWSQGQLEREIENGDWLLQKSINSLIFEKSTDHIWHIAANSLGIEINDIMNHPGKS